MPGGVSAVTARFQLRVLEVATAVDRRTDALASARRLVASLSTHENAFAAQIMRDRAYARRRYANWLARDMKARHCEPMDQQLFTAIVDGEVEQGELRPGILTAYDSF